MRALFWKGLRPIIARALALRPRGGVRRDALGLTRLSGQLQIEWTARVSHPWDRQLPAQHQRDSFLLQAAEDVDAALVRLFDRLPEIDAITLRVVSPQPDNRIIMAGTVLRGDLEQSKRWPSVRMRLWMLGIRDEDTTYVRSVPASAHRQDVTRHAPLPARSARGS
jgi:hypothetical protein